MDIHTTPEFFPPPVEYALQSPPAALKASFDSTCSAAIASGSALTAIAGSQELIESLHHQSRTCTLAELLDLKVTTKADNRIINVETDFKAFAETDLAKAGTLDVKASTEAALNIAGPPKLNMRHGPPRRKWAPSSTLIDNRKITKEVRLNVIPNVPKDIYKFSAEEIADVELDWSARSVGW